MARFGFIGNQYEDDAGAPLIEGKLFFFESGTTTAKDTFADVNLTILNTNPVILTAAGRQPNVFFSGSARVMLTDSDDVQIEVRDPIGGESAEGSFNDWNALTIYNIPDIVVRNDLFYISITDGNQDNDPATDTLNWTQVKFTRVWNTNETYSINALAQGSGGSVFKSTTNGNIGNDPETDAINWTGASAVDIPPIVKSASKIFAYRNL
jgi:hypothetical protein